MHVEAEGVGEDLPVRRDFVDKDPGLRDHLTGEREGERLLTGLHVESVRHQQPPSRRYLKSPMRSLKVRLYRKNIKVKLSDVNVIHSSYFFACGEVYK